MKNIIEITDTASQRIKDIISKADDDTLGLRIAVKSGGCAGYSYDMDYIKEVNPSDEVVEHDGVKVFIDQAAIMFLLGSTMDFKKEKFICQAIDPKNSPLGEYDLIFCFEFYPL